MTGQELHLGAEIEFRCGVILDPISLQPDGCFISLDLQAKPINLSRERKESWCHEDKTSQLYGVETFVASMDQVR